MHIYSSSIFLSHHMLPDYLSDMDSSSMSCFQTPRHCRQLNTFACEPLTPKNVRVIRTLSPPVLSQIHNWSIPSALTGSGKSISIPSPGVQRSSAFKDALKCMRDGTSLQRLQQQRAMENIRTTDRVEDEVIGGVVQRLVPHESTEQKEL